MCYKFESCLSLDSYIKPQPDGGTIPYVLVVYLLIPTSNHNKTVLEYSNVQLFIS